MGVIVDRKKKERYLLAVYSVVLLLSIVLIFVGLQITEQPDLKSIILNISTELFAIVLIFFVINKIFMVDQWNAEEKIELLTKSIENSKKTRAIDFFEYKINLSEYNKKSTKIEMCGVTLSSDINANFTLFREKILNGCDIKFMLIDPDSSAPEMSSLRSEDEGNDKYYRRKLDITFGDFEYLVKSINNSNIENKKTGKLEIKLLSYPPSFAINRFTKQNGEQELIIEMYAHKVGYDSPPMFRLNSKRDKKWFNHFSEQYDAMWNVAKKWSSNEKTQSKQQDIKT